MRKLITNYSFDKTAKTVTFNDYGSISLNGVLLVVNVTSNVVIYNFTTSAKGGSASGNVLTLTYNTSSMNNADKLMVYYDDGSSTVTIDTTGLATSTKQSDGSQKTQVVDGSGNVITTNSTTTTSKFGLDNNILSILGTAPTTAGKLDIKGADGDVFSASGYRH